MLEHGNEGHQNLLKGRHFYLALTPKELKDKGLHGEYFTVKYGVISRHYNKNPNHTWTKQNWIDLCQAITDPFAIAKYNDGFRLFTKIKINNNWGAVGVTVKSKNMGRNLPGFEINALTTLFGYDGDITRIPNLIWPENPIDETNLPSLSL